LPAVGWFTQELLFYGVAQPVPDAESTTGATAGEQEFDPASPPSSKPVMLLFERRTRDWFLLAPEKRQQLLAPRRDTLAQLAALGLQTYDSLGFGPYSQLTVLRHLTLDEFARLREALQSHWEQKYVDAFLVYLGFEMSPSRFLASLR